MLHSWEVLGGIEFGKLSIYTPIYEENKTMIISNAEKKTESFYRIMRQKRNVTRSSDSIIFSEDIKASFEPVLNNEIHNEVNNKANTNKEPEVFKSTQEQDIKEITSLFKKQLNVGEKK